MLGRDDNIYEGSSLIGTTLRVGMYTGLGYGALRFMQNPEEIKSLALRGLDVVAPKVDPDLTKYQESLQQFRNIATLTGKDRLKREELNKSLKEAAIKEKLLPSSVEDILAINIDVDIPDAGKITDPSFSYSSFDEIEDITGRKIGKDIEKRLREISKNMSEDKLLIDKTTWDGTTAVIPTESGRKLPINFSKRTEDSAMIVKRGSTFYSAPLLSHAGLNEAGNAIESLNLVDWNTNILNLLKEDGGRMQALDRTVASTINDADLIRTLEDGSLINLQQRLSRQFTEGQALEDAKARSLFSKLKMALGGLEEELRHVDPLSTLEMTINEGLIAPDPGNLYDIATHPGMKGYGSERLEFNAVKSVFPREARSSSRVIDQTLFGISELTPEQITLNNQAKSIVELAQSGDNTAARLLEDIESGGGINRLVSQSQVAKGTSAIGGAIFGPPIPEGYKGVAWNEYISGNIPRTYQGRYTYRYGVDEGASRTSRLSQELAEKRTARSTPGIIDFMGDEGIFIDKKASRIFTHDTQVQAKIGGYTDDISNQKILLRNMVDKDLDPIKIPLSDLYNTHEGSYLHEAMTSGDYELMFDKDLAIGIESKARPVTGESDTFGMYVQDSVYRLKGKSVMGKAEYEAFLGLNRDVPLDQPYSIPLRLRSPATKLAVSGTTQRSIASFMNLESGFITNELGEEVVRTVTSSEKLAYAARQVLGETGFGNIEIGFGADLMKAVFPKEVIEGDLYQLGKQASEMTQSLHNLLLGEVDALSASHTDASFILEGKTAEVFKKYLLDDIDTDTVNLNQLLKDGQARFRIPSSDQSEYSEQLENLLHIYQEARYMQANKMVGDYGIGVIGDTPTAPQGYLTEAWQESKDFWQSLKETDRYEGVPLSQLADEQLRPHIWSILPQITQMESRILTQGAKGFNTATFAMRDMYMAIGTDKGSIIQEMLSRNEVDTKRIMMEQELLRASVSRPEKMEELVAGYQAYLKDVYGEKVAEEYGKQLSFKVKDDVTDMIADAEAFMGKGAPSNINLIRENPELATETFLAPDHNIAGKLFRGEDGRLIHIPSATALGGITALEDGRITFEGKQSANVPKFYNLMEKIRQTGTAPNTMIDKTAASMIRLADILSTERSKIKIHAASYARHIYDRSLAQHDVMSLIDERAGAFANISSKSRSTIGHIATISERDASLMIQDELMQAVESIKDRTGGTSNLVKDALNELHSDWISKDHGGIISDIDISLKQKMIDANVESIKGLASEDVFKVIEESAREIVAERKVHTDTLIGMMDELNMYSQAGADEKIITNKIDNIVEFVKGKSLSVYAARDPIIYSSSELALHGFIMSGVEIQGKNADELSKTISVAFAAARNIAGDFDGDKLKYFLLHSRDAIEATGKLVTDSQMKSEIYLGEMQKRIKLMSGHPDGKKQIFNLTKEQLDQTVGGIFRHDRAAVPAAFITKAYTGSLNIGALGMKGRLHKLLSDGNLTQEELVDAVSYINSMPSLLTEQQAISSKHLTRYIGENIDESISPVEAVIGAIGKLDQKQAMDLIAESGGVHPAMITMLSKVASEKGQRVKYEDAIELANVILNYQTGYSNIEESQLVKFRSYLQGERTDDQWIEFIDKVLERQKNRTPIVETEWAKKLKLPESSVELFAEMHRAGSNNFDKILKDAAKYITENNEKLEEQTVRSLMEVADNLRRDAFHISEDIFGSSAQLIPEAARRPKGWSWAKEQIAPAANWFREAPLERIGGAVAIAAAATAILNLTSGSTVDSVEDIPSMNNPGMEASSRTFRGEGIFAGNNLGNQSFGLLTSGNLSHRQSASSIPSSGYHSVSYRQDETNPYLNSMMYYQ